MRQEAFRLLAQKIAGVRDDTAVGFDYHIDGAYEKIKNRLPPEPLSGAELEVWLRPLLQDPAAAGSEREFLTLVDHFVLGMSLEIINTLDYECQQAEELVAQVDKLAGEWRRTPGARESLEAAVRRLELNKKLPGMIQGVERRWRVPHAGGESFSAFSAWKKNMTGRNADKDLRLVFDLGDRYRDRYPFLDGFMEKFRGLAEAFRLAVRGLDALGTAGSSANP
jgi:hypothetical protein